MPQTTPEHAARWPGMDHEAISFLEGNGYKLLCGWNWVKPTPEHDPSDREIDAILYLIQEWDFGGLVPEVSKT